jgi:hypothetical protein
MFRIDFDNSGSHEKKKAQALQAESSLYTVMPEIMLNVRQRQ